MTDGSRKAIFAAFFANLGIAIAKFVGFLITGSASLLAETVHSGADTGNQLLLFLGGQRAKKSATPTHPFGYGRERYFWSFAVALVLFSMGGMFALYEGIQKFRHPHDVESLGVAVTILVVAILLESYSLHTAVKESRRVKDPAMGWWRFIRTTKQPELPVVLLEDVGALTGLFLALGGVLMASNTGDARWDAVGSMSIGVLLIVIAVVLIIEMKSLLIGESASAGTREAIVAAIESVDTVDQLIHIRTEHIGPDEILVGAKVEYSSALSADELVAAINTTEDSIRAAVPAATVIYLEPDLRRDDHPDLIVDVEH
ncbi:MAG: cation diffusion facilitator family transporter [Ilumatobacteraceae bacterium]